MTIADAIDRVDTLKVNKYTPEQKIGWLSELDGQIFKEIICRHERTEEMPETFEGYSPDMDTTTELLVPSPYSDLYIHYLSAQIDLFNGEITKYNNSKTLYNTAYLAYDDAYTRAHMPLARVQSFHI